MRPAAKPSVRVQRWEAGLGLTSLRDELAAEEPLEIRVDGQAVCVTMRTPGQDEELAAGFLLSEGLIQRRAEILKLGPHPRNPGNVINVWLRPEAPLDFARLRRHVYVSSSCGLCGKTSIASVHQHFKPVPPGLKVAARTLLALPAALRAQQETFERTGGLHAAAVFTLAGKRVVVREDVGRHNAADKVLGYGLLHDLLPWNRHILMVSGRASFELLQKALAARIPIVAAVSAPSTLAVEFARRSRQTLVGFLRHQRLNVYTLPRRVQF